MKLYTDIIKWIEQFNTLIGALSFVVSTITLFLSLRIKKKIDTAKSEQKLKMNNAQIIGDIDGFLVFLQKNDYTNDIQSKIKIFIIDITASYPLVEKNCKKNIKNINEHLSNWEIVRSSLVKIKTYIEGV